MLYENCIYIHVCNTFYFFVNKYFMGSILLKWNILLDKYYFISAYLFIFLISMFHKYIIITSIMICKYR